MRPATASRFSAFPQDRLLLLPGKLFIRFEQNDNEKVNYRSSCLSILPVFPFIVLSSFISCHPYTDRRRRDLTSFACSSYLKNKITFLTPRNEIRGFAMPTQFCVTRVHADHEKSNFHFAKFIANDNEVYLESFSFAHTSTADENRFFAVAALTFHKSMACVGRPPIATHSHLTSALKWMSRAIVLHK